MPPFGWGRRRDPVTVEHVTPPAELPRAGERRIAGLDVQTFAAYVLGDKAAMDRLIDMRNAIRPGRSA